MLREPVLSEWMVKFFSQYGVEHPETGVYVCETLNFRLAIEDKAGGSYGPYGVCDSLEQLKSHPTWAMITGDERPFALVLTPIRRSEQEPQGGWRWHKWGEYIGERSPCREYLADEPEIDLVFVFEAVALA